MCCISPSLKYNLISYAITFRWANYIKGVVHHFPAVVPGFNAVISTNVPIGGGLSSSASLEVASCTFLEALTKVHLSSQAEKALLCQKAEHTFAHMPCGIMDQMISVMGQADHALLIDCQFQTATRIPFKAPDLAVLIINSNVKHELSSSQYSVRREECARALEDIGWSSYRTCCDDIDSFDLDSIISRVKDNVHRRRAKHVITEIQRTLAAAQALEQSDFKRMGELMNESHASLDEDFEVSCPETNVLVYLTRQCSGVYGSRQTGGGFGGCTVTIIDKDKVNTAIEYIRTRYAKETGYEASFFVAAPSDGARVLKGF